MSPDLCTLVLKCTHQIQLLQIQSHLTTYGLISSVFILNTLIRAHSKTPSPHHAIPLYSHLLRSSLRPDTHTLTFLLKACSLIPSRPTGLSVHTHALHLGLASHLFTANALIHFHSSTGDVPSARFILQGMPAPDPVSYNSMISGYVKTGDIASARALFDEMPQRNSITWTAVIAGYVQCGLSKEALLLFSRMQADGFRPNDSTMTSVLAACAHTGALEQGEWVHGYLRSSEVEISVFLGSALIDMYAKCGKVELGLEVFRNMRERNLLVWTTMIKGLAMHGRGLEALKLFSEMERSGVVPDDIAFIGALCACTHAGLVDEGRRVFDSMIKCYGIRPKIEHYGCMMDLLARNGFLDEARCLVESMPMKPDALIWGALMAGCRFHKNVVMAEHVVRHLIELEPDSSGVYVLLANIYAASGRHDDARRVRFSMMKKRVVKTPGCSMVEIGGSVHQFLVGDTSHPQMKHILMKWEEIENRIRLEGYVPSTDEVLFDIDGEEKDDALARHSEKLAIAFGLISTDAGISIRVVKNLRVCSDCHHVTKLISKVYNREIIVRDRMRFHLFKGGTCTCNDYW